MSEKGNKIAGVCNIGKKSKIKYLYIKKNKNF
jgi:hypothetical protein